MRLAGRVLKEAGGVRSSVSGLPATRVTCRKGKTEGTRKRMRERLPFVTIVEA